MKRLYTLLMVATLFLMTNYLHAQATPLFMVSNNNSNLYQVDTTNGGTSNLGSLSPVGGGSISQCNGLAVHPCTGEIYAVVQYSSGSGRSIAVIDTNANAQIIGNTNDLVATIAFDDDGTLYAVTGDGANSPENMYTVNLSTGSISFFQSLGNGSDGEAIAYCPDNGKMYHWSGWSGSLSSIVFESIDLNTNTVTNIGMTGSVSPISIISAVYMGGGQFLVSHHNSNGIAVVDTNGLIVATGGSTTVPVKGMAFKVPSGIAVGSDKDRLCPSDTALLTAS